MLVSLVTVIVLHLIPGLSRESSNFALFGIRLGITSACIAYVRACGVNGTLPDPLKVLTGKWTWPVDIRTAMEYFDLTPDLVLYASCPRCCCLYRPKSATSPRFPEFCKFQEFRGQRRCGERLIQEREEGKPTIALKTFAYQPFQTWLGKLLARPGLIESMKATTAPWKDPKTLWRDVFGARALREFVGPDGKTPFLEAPNGELRLAFNLNIDWFHPFGAKVGGSHLSVGGIYMVCMNLPTHLRYRLENVYLVGIMPGPREPSMEQINHFLNPLIDDLLRFWSPGILFSKTASHPFGCLVRCALIALVCDTPAARKTIGSAASTANHLCSFCRILQEDKSNFNVSSWPRWSREDYFQAAKLWRDAPTMEEREAEFARNQVRWSDLLRLPYWDYTKFVVVDAMHNLFLNDLSHHCRDLWGMDQTKSPHKGMEPHTPAEQTEEIRKVLDTIIAKNQSKLASFRKGYLVVFARLNSVHIPTAKGGSKPVKAELAAGLVAWVRTIFVNGCFPINFRSDLFLVAKSKPNGVHPYPKSSPGACV